MSITFRINSNLPKDSSVGFCQLPETIHVSQNNTERRRMYLFLIGGSGGTILRPLLFMFYNSSTLSNYSIVPIFIDRSFHSKNVAESINAISRYRIFCKYSNISNQVDMPFFFVTNGNIYKDSSNISRIIEQITKDDVVLFSFSVMNENNIALHHQIKEQIRNLSTCRIFNIMFLPYFKFDNDNYRIQNDNTRQILSSIKYLSNEHTFYIGNSEPSIFEHAHFQDNPFDVVMLIASYWASMCTSLNIIQENTFYNYSLDCKNIHSLKDVIPDSQLREIVIKLDFKLICWNFLSSTESAIGFVNNLPKEKFSLISNILTEPVLLIKQLTDKKIHPELQIYLRNNNSGNFTEVWKNFTTKRFGIRRFMTKEEFSKELLLNIDKNSIDTDNWLIHEILDSIDLFIDQNFDTISKLYY